MHDDSYLRGVLVFLVAAVVVVPLFQRARTGPVLGYLAAGALIGPHAFALIQDPDSAAALAELGVVFLLFAIGLDLSLDRLWSMRRYIFGLGSAQVLLTGALIAVIAHLFGFEPGTAILVGGALALSSTAFVLRLLQDRGEHRTRYGRIAIAILLLQDLAVVPLLALVPLLASAGENVGGAIGLAFAKAVAAVTAVALVGRFVVGPVYRLVAAGRNPELFSAMTLLIVLGTAWITFQAGLSMALGAFLAGLLLSETEYRHQVEADIQPFRGLFLGLFFMSVGMTLDLGLLADRVGALLAIAAALMVGKGLVIAALSRLFRIETVLALRLGLVLAQGGEFAFILLSLAATAGLLPLQLSQELIAAVILTMLATPVAGWAGTQLARRSAPRSADVASDLARETADLADHAIIAGYGRVGQTVAKLFDAQEIPYVALDMKIGRVRNCRRHGMKNVFYGDASNRDVLAAAGAERARVIVLTLDKVDAAEHATALLHREFPDQTIVARSRDRAHARALEAAGAGDVVLESAEASLQLGAVALRGFGAGDDAIAPLLDDLRADDYARLDDIVGGDGVHPG